MKFKLYHKVVISRKSIFKRGSRAHRRASQVTFPMINRMMYHYARAIRYAVIEFGLVYQQNGLCSVLNSLYMWQTKEVL